MKKILLTLCIVHQDSMVLLGMKKRGFGAGNWNGFGGKVEKGETIEEGAIRELKEESGIKEVVVSKMGILDFEFESDKKKLELHIFLVNNFKGNPKETEEMNPKWFDKDEIPFKNMWSCDSYWIPLILKGKKFKGYFLYDRPTTPDYPGKIIKHNLEEVKVL